MPKRNSIKSYEADQYYHIFNRGGNQQDIFIEPEDYFYFLNLFRRHLSKDTVSDRYGRLFEKYYDKVELVAFCLMPNHFHLLCLLKEPDGIVHLMRSTMTAYTMYFNKKYKHTGKLYESAFLATRINNEAYLWQVSRYIHLNPIEFGYDFHNYAYSSMTYYTENKKTDWIMTNRLVETDRDKQEYLEFVTDYETMNQDMKYLKNILAAE